MLALLTVPCCCFHLLLPPPTALQSSPALCSACPADFPLLLLSSAAVFTSSVGNEAVVAVAALSIAPFLIEVKNKLEGE